MQKENIPYGEHTTAEKSSSDTGAATPLFFSSNNPFLSPTSPNYVNSNASAVYSSLFQNYSPVDSPTSFTSFEGWDTDLHLQDASCIFEYQQLYNRYTLCLSHMHDSIDAVDALRRENESLRLSNADLSHRVALLFSRDMLLSEFNHLTVASPATVTTTHSVHVIAAPQPLDEHNRLEQRSTERVTLPKSISVRSTGYLKTNQPRPEPTRQISVSQPVPALQRVYVPGAGTKKEKSAALEFEVYNQGMSKTELCNKWQETGACPYGDNCQFAHGIKEMRPVIRHPRYKTEICRMVLAGDSCPYGHRCHFRHALTDQERLMATPLPR